jgi:tetratricopeptide (TPR) repeat protein
MYIPILGVFTMAVWQTARIVQTWPQTRITVAAATVCILVCLGLVSARQVPAWKNSIALYQHSIAVGEDNAAVRYLLAVAFQAAGRPQAEVVTQYQRALAHRPDYVNALTQLAIIAISNQRMDEARKIIEETIRLEPNNPGLRANLAAYWLRTGRPDEAIRNYEHVLRLDPKSSGAHHELGQIYVNQNRYDEGRAHYEASARLDPWNAEGLCDYGTLLANLGRPAEGRGYLQRALWLRPDMLRARQNLSSVDQLLQQKR